MHLAVVIKQCGEDQLVSKLGLVLFEQLSEEYLTHSVVSLLLRVRLPMWLV